MKIFEDFNVRDPMGQYEEAQRYQCSRLCHDNPTISNLLDWTAPITTPRFQNLFHGLAPKATSQLWIFPEGVASLIMPLFQNLLEGVKLEAAKRFGHLEAVSTFIHPKATYAINHPEAVTAFKHLKACGVRCLTRRSKLRSRRCQKHWKHHPSSMSGVRMVASIQPPRVSQSC